MYRSLLFIALVNIDPFLSLMTARFLLKITVWPNRVFHGNDNKLARNAGIYEVYFNVTFKT